MKMRKNKRPLVSLIPDLIPAIVLPSLPLRTNIELQPHTHTSQLNVQELEHTRHRHDRHIFTTTIPHPLRIHPQIRFTAIRIRQHRTPPAADREILAAPVLLTAVLSDSMGSAEERAAGTAYGCFCVVGTVHEAVLQQEGCTVGKQGVALHFSDTDTAALAASFDGLAGCGDDGAGGSGLELIVYHCGVVLVHVCEKL